MNPASPHASSTAPHDGPIVVFDGVCALCSGWVHFLLRHDHRAGFRFAAMQDRVGRDLLVAHGIDPDDPVSFLLVDGDAGWHDSDGVIEVLRRLGGVWRVAGALRVVPRALRDPAYRLLARNRYRMFGRRETCMVPPAEVRARFL
ncbi:thiol-disulfide oxidoreductase DCC family protein [Luteimonas fraxinea]|uniref:Thiol-disulfide oxidoreductase DCC family protein n=1 Tax=Luteimonas fraxinea TaxID=2901869 RepID=A0ABS8UHS6_9GAMM|nr:DCC1-like thiol-disulfide oxidoreductase family protein [Luteimonas fraxinea]MCD9098844.1 thiol-disulfide oxidoreductase DCC family protein [Luteimonas fraxinea]UHH09098.1 thiol-disulfide oxidoreductase DCC family protein [Luteimonas fraxinea]